MLQNQERASDMMVNSAEYWSRVADYLLMYDQIVIPTGNMQILSVLRFMLGDDVLLELLQTRAIVFTRFDHWFGYIGTVGIAAFKFGDNPDLERIHPNLAITHFQPLGDAIDGAFISMNPASSTEVRQRYRTLLLDTTAQLQTEQLLKEVRDEAYRDIQGSPYLQELLAIRNAERGLDNLVGSKPDTVSIFNPHVPATNLDHPEIRAVLRVAFENFLLAMGGKVQANELAGDSSILSVLQAKGQRHGYSPQGRNAFAQLMNVAGVPALGAAFASKQLSARQILDLRQSKHAQSFRDWLSSGGAASTAEETVRRYVETVGKPSLIETLPAKLLRFAATTAWGVVEPVSGGVAAFTDAFMLSKWYPGTSPRLFMTQAKLVIKNTPVIKPPVLKGRDRNALCSCGSMKKYKVCCGRA